MKIENKYVKIKNGRTYEFKNTITDDYLKVFTKSQYDNNYKKLSATEKELTYCYIKTDSEINSNDSTLPAEYNYRLPVITDYEKGSDIIEINYVYNNVSGYAKSDGTTFNEITNINDIVNQKLIKLGFGNENNVYAYVDVSACNIIMTENEFLYIYRKDTLSSDAKYTGNYYPAHLSPLGIKIEDYNYYGELYSIGFGFTKGIINEEYLISDNPVTEINDYTYQVELERGYDDTLTPNEVIYPNNNLYSVYEVHLQGVYPNSIIYPNSNLQPGASDYKYLIYKYRLYRVSGNDIIESDYYYTMSYYTEHKGQIYMNTKLERS